MDMANARLSEDGKTIIIRIPYKFKRTGGRKQIIAPEGADSAFLPEARHDEALIKAVVRAHRWQEMLNTGQAESVQDLAVKEKITPSYLARHLRLTALAPDIVEAILAGRQPESMTLTSLWKVFPLEWEYQREQWGFPAVN